MKRTLLALNSLLPEEMAALEAHFEIIRLWKEADPEAVIRDHSKAVQAVLTGFSPVRKKLIEALPNLEVIATNSVGTDHIDLVTAAARGIAVANTPDLVTADTADLALALILGLSRRTMEADMYVRVGKWPGGNFGLAHSLSGKTVGIVGLGRIGQAIARRVEAFDMDIVYHGRHEQPDQPYRYYPELEDMARDCDFLVLACPGGAQTRHLVGADILSALGPSGWLVNIARGSVVDEAALVDALSYKKIVGAGLDVYENEPNVPDALFTMDNVVLLPHIGTATVETRKKMGLLVIENLLAYFNGQPLKTPVAA